MEAGTKETLCSKFLHLWVCKYKIGSAVTWKLVKTKYERIAKEELLETTSKADAIFDGSRFNYELKFPEYIENGTIASRTVVQR